LILEYQALLVEIEKNEPEDLTQIEPY